MATSTNTVAAATTKPTKVAKTKASKSPAAALAVAEGVAAADAAASTPTDVTDDAMDASPSVSEDAVPETVVEPITFASVFAKIAVGLAKFKEIAADLKALQKETARIAKESVRRPRRVADPSAEPSGFRKPVGLSPEMAAFVGVALDAKVSRNNVTKAVTTYIKANNLQDSPDKRVILPDATLRALLGVEDQKLTYFNLQSFLKKHFMKTDGSVSATTAEPAPGAA